MAAKPSEIKCPKCGFQPNILTDTCLKCSTKLVKVCGECGFANNVEKNYCDQCGAVLAMQPPPKPAQDPEAEARETEAKTFSLEMESIQDTVSDRATSFRRKAVPPPPQSPAAPGGPGKPPPHPGQVVSGKVSGPLTADSARLPAQSALPKTRKKSFLQKLTGTGVTILLAGVLLGILYMIAAPSFPKLRLLMAAKSYLSYISEGKFEKAYELFSSNSKAACSLEEYLSISTDYYSKTPAWQFKDVQVFAMTEDSAMVKYMLKEGDGDWKPDYISFVREHNRWTRPYIWVLFQPIDDALRRHDFPQALFLAQKLYLTDPVDPRTSGYLCVTEFFMGLHEKSAESCKRTIDTASIYPVGYTNDELFQFHSYYADSLRYLQRDRPALIEYDKLLKWPTLTQKQQCPLRLNRADSYIYLKEYDRALQEVMTASEICPDDPEKSDAKKRLYFMSGSAGPAAIDFAKKSRFQKGQPSIAESRKQQLAALKAKLGARGARYLPTDSWMAVHVAGPEYRVFLRQKARDPRTGRFKTEDIYVFLINLWTSKAKVEKAPQQTGG